MQNKIMGYSIDNNSYWARHHINEINELNSILDDPYLIEQKIANECNIVRCFKAALAEEIERMNWDAICKYMQQTNWTWSMADGHKSIPSQQHMIDTLYELLKEGLHHIIVDKDNDFMVSTGGFVLSMGVRCHQHVSEHDCWVSVAFDIS